MAQPYQSGYVVVNEVRARHETIYGVKTHYVHAGDGEPLVLVHGAGPGASGDAGWRNAIPALAKHFHVYAIDLLGYGHSDKPRIEYSYQTHVNHVAGFVDALNLQNIRICGNSQGAYVAMKYVLDNPARVARVALISTGTLATAMGLRARGRATPLPRFDGSKETLRAFIEVIVNDPSKITDELIDSRFAIASLPGHREMRESMRQYGDALKDNPNERQLFEVKDRLPQLTIPWCMIWGEEDRSAPLDPLGNGLHALFPDVPFHVVKGSGHQVQNDQPEACNRLLVEWFTSDVREPARA
jgi:pimeloyl-ACP methyl ester carboxylesterase